MNRKAAGVIGGAMLATPFTLALLDVLKDPITHFPFVCAVYFLATFILIGYAVLR